MQLSHFLSYFERVWQQPKDVDVKIQFQEQLSDPEHEKNSRLLEIVVVSYAVHEHTWTVLLREASSNTQDEDERT